MSLPLIINKETITFSPQAVKDSSYGFCPTVLEDFITPYGILIPINSAVFSIKDWLETGYYPTYNTVMDSACLPLTRHNRLYIFRDDESRMLPVFRAYPDMIKTHVHYPLELQTYGEHATAINALAFERELNAEETIALAKESLSKQGIPVERLQTFSRIELVAKVQEMYPNDENNTVGDLAAFIEKSIARHNKRRESLKE